MFRARAAITEQARAGDMMPAVVSRWLEEKAAAGDWSEDTKTDMDRVAAAISKRFLDFRPYQVTTPVCAEYLKTYLKKPRTYNLHRSVLRQVMAAAAREGLREGHNPIDNIPQRKLAKRVRIVTPAEIDAMAAALMKAKRGGPAHVRMLGLCLKTGQRIGDVLKFRAQDCTDEGVIVDQGKTGAPLVVEWDAELKALVDECFAGRDRIGFLLVQSTGQPYRYSGVRSAWVRAMERAGIEDLHIHDLRGEAGARLADMLGPYAAQLLLGHASVKMTEQYIAGKTRKRAKPAPMKKSV
jgi:integrase